MLKPSCPKCNGTDGFSTVFTSPHGDALAYLVFCIGCGHVIGVLPHEIKSK